MIKSNRLKALSVSLSNKRKETNMSSRKKTLRTSRNSKAPLYGGIKLAEDFTILTNTHSPFSLECIFMRDFQLTKRQLVSSSRAKAGKSRMISRRTLSRFGKITPTTGNLGLSRGTDDG